MIRHLRQYRNNTRRSKKRMMGVVCILLLIVSTITTFRTNYADVEFMLHQQQYLYKKTTTMTTQSLFDIHKIPSYMIDYFEWHGQQIQKIQQYDTADDTDANADADNNNTDTDTDLNSSFLSNYRFLILRCASSSVSSSVSEKDKEGNSSNNNRDDMVVVPDRCGGLSDRLKSFPLFILYAAVTNRLLFFYWDDDRPANIEQFLIPADTSLFWNWTVPEVLKKTIYKNINKNNTKNKHRHSRVYFDGLQNHIKTMKQMKDDTIWLIEGNDHTGGATRYKYFIDTNTTFASTKTNATGITSSDYSNFYHDLFHATFRPSQGVANILNAYFRDPPSPPTSPTSTESVVSNTATTTMTKMKHVLSKSWLPVPLQHNNYVVVQYRAKYPLEPYRETNNRTILQETTLHAINCAQSRMIGSGSSSSTATSSLTNNYSNSNNSGNSSNSNNIYMTSDTALAVEVAHNMFPYSNFNNNDNNKDRQKSSSSSLSSSVNVWSYLDLLSYGIIENIDDNTNITTTTTTTTTTTPAIQQTITLAEDPPHINFMVTNEDTDFYVVFVDLFLMSYARCVYYGAGGFGRWGSLVSYHPKCGIPYTINHGTLVCPTF